MAMYELTLIRNIPPKEDNPGWVDMLHIALDCDDIEDWTREYTKSMSQTFPGVCFTYITHYEEFNSPETYRYPRAIELEHLK